MLKLVSWGKLHSSRESLPCSVCPHRTLTLSGASVIPYSLSVSMATRFSWTQHNFPKVNIKVTQLIFEFFFAYHGGGQTQSSMYEQTCSRTNVWTCTMVNNMFTTFQKVDEGPLSWIWICLTLFDGRNTRSHIVKLWWLTSILGLQWHVVCYSSLGVGYISVPQFVTKFYTN